MTLIQLLDSAWVELEWCAMRRSCSDAYNLVVVFRDNRYFQ